MPRPARRSARLAAAVVATLPLSIPAAPARAANVSWSSSVSGRWLAPANWSAAAVPTSGDTTTIATSGTYTVTLDGSTTAGPVTLNAPGATLSLATNPLSFSTGPLAVSAGKLAIQSFRTGTTRISATSFTNAGTVTFDADLETSTFGQLYADISTGSGAVVNSGTIETHAAATNPFPPQTPHYSPTYSFTGNPGATFTNTGTLRAAVGSVFNLNNYIVNQNAGLLDRGVAVLSGALNYNGGACSPDLPTYLGNSALKIAASATAGNFILADNASTLTSNIPAGNTVSTYGTAPVRWTGVGSTFTNAGRLVVGSYPFPPVFTTATPSFSLNSSTNVLLNTGTLELNSPSLPATTLTGSITNQGAITVNAAYTAASSVPTRLSGSFTQNAGGSLAIDPSAPLALPSGAHFYFNAGTVAGPVSLDNATVHFAPGLASTGSGTFTYTPSSTPATPFTGDIPSGATFVHTIGSLSSSFVLSSFTNAGSLRTSSAVSTSARPTYRLENFAGTLTNTGSMGGTLKGVDRGIALLINGSLVNTGDIKANYLSVSGTPLATAPRPSFDQNAGTLNVDDLCLIIRATFNYNGGTITGKPIGITDSTLSIAPNTKPASFTFFMGDNILHGSPAAGSTLALDALTPGLGFSPVTVTADPFTNAGTLSLGATFSAFTSTLSVTGSGALTNTGTLSVTKGFGGTRTLNANVTNTGTFSVGPGATLTLYGSITTSTPLDLQGTLDLRTGALTWTNPTPTTADTLRTLLATSHLTNSTADARHRLAYTFSGEPTAPTSLTVQLALAGDANLDGQLNADDFTLIDRGLATTGSYWWQGDFDYDGQITSADYLLIDTSYAQTHPLSPALLSQREQQFGPDYVSQLLTNVPEPSSLACLFATLPLLTRRRTKP